MWKGIITTIIALTLGGCFIVPPTTTPMHEIAAQTGRHSDTLLVMLPGRGSRAEDFVNYGFFKMAKGRGFDMVAADAHAGYYYKRNAIERLDEDIIEPARAHGYKHVWLLGISLGGMGAILYAEHHPEVVDGLILLAPYTGDTGLLKEIDKTGLAQWNGTSNKGEAFQRELWLWLKDVTRTPGSPVIVLGYGTSDRFAAVGDILGPRLPTGRQFTEPGGHNWNVWKVLWRDILKAGIPPTKSVAHNPSPADTHALSGGLRQGQR